MGLADPFLTYLNSQSQFHTTQTRPHDAVPGFSPEKVIHGSDQVGSYNVFNASEGGTVTSAIFCPSELVSKSSPQPRGGDSAAFTN